MEWFQEDLITRTRLFQKTGASKTPIGELMMSQQFMELTLKDFINIDQFHSALLSNASKTLCINQIPKVCGLQKTGENKTNTMVLSTSQQFMEPV